VDRNGNTFVTGESRVNGSAYATLAYSATGASLWTNWYYSPGNAPVIACAIGQDNAGHVFVTGSSSRQNLFDYATVAYSTAGISLWTNRCSGPAAGSSFPTALAVAPWGEVFVTGYSYAFEANSVYATVKYSSSVLTPARLGIALLLTRPNQRERRDVVLTWTNSDYVLQSAPAPIGSFTNVPAATSPFTNLISAPSQFFRLWPSVPEF
jgi:hypothetical protein